MIVDFNEMLNKARENKYGIPAVTTWDERSIRMTLEAAVGLASPVILGFVKNYGRNEVYKKGIAHNLAESVNIPVSFYCDHGSTFEDSMWGISARFNCIMIDRPKLSYEEYVNETKELVKIAHGAGVSVEANVGNVPHAVFINKDKSERLEYTDVEIAKKFVTYTNVDVLSISIGNLHGVYTGTPEIDYERLLKISKTVPAFLSIHGSSGIEFNDITKLAKAGITKFCMQSYLSKAAINSAKEYMKKNKNNPDPRALLLKTISEVADKGWKKELKKYIEAMGARGKAV